MRTHALAVAGTAVLIAAGGGIALASTGHGAPGARRPARGVVAGKFEREGGPIAPGGKQQVVPLTGTIRFARAHHRTVRVHVGKSGRFSARLVPGYYEISGRTPDIRGPGRQEAVCPVPGKVRVSADRTRHITVACIVP